MYILPSPVHVNCVTWDGGVFAFSLSPVITTNGPFLCKRLFYKCQAHTYVMVPIRAGQDNLMQVERMEKT